MAFSASYDTTSPGAAALNREELHDAISLLAPGETPILSSASKFKCSSTNPEWGVDKLDAPVATAVVEGEDVSTFDDKFAGVARLGNYVQKMRKSFRVSDIQEAVESAGAQNIARAETKATRELKRDIEKVLMSTQDRVIGSDGQASTMRALGDWIDSTGPTDVPAAYRTPSGSIHASGTFTETILSGMITSAYRVSGKSQDLTLVADTALRAVITNFARADTTTGANRSWNNDSSSSLIKLSVSIYQGDHGSVGIVDMNPDCANDTTNKDSGYLLNPDYYSVGELITMGSSRLPDLGGGPRGLVDWTGTLKVSHPGAHGKVVGF